MGLSPLNLQLSVPRSPELSNLQQQMTQRPMTEQTILESSLAKEADEKRTQTQALIETENEIIKDHQQNNNQQHNNNQNQNKKKSNTANDKLVDASHPYKGKHFDMKL